MSPSLFPPWVTSKTLLQKQTKKGRTSPNSLRIAGALIKLGFLTGNLNTSCFSIDLFPFLNLFFPPYLFCGQWKWRHLLGYLKAIIIMLFPHHFFPGYNNPLNLSSKVQFSPHSSMSGELCGFMSSGRRQSLAIWLPCVSWPSPICTFF